MPLTELPIPNPNTPQTFVDHSTLLSLIDKALRISETRYRRLFETAQDGILLLNAATGQIEDVNPFLITMLGYSHEEFLGKKLWEIGAFKNTDICKTAFVELQSKRYIRYDNLPLVAKDGTRFSVEFVSNVYDCEGLPVIQCNIRDNTKRHLAEAALKATSRALNIINASNVALLQTKTETLLLTEFCRIAVETGGYGMAWIGVAEHDADKKITMLAHFGQQAQEFSLFNSTWAETEQGDNPTGLALRLQEIQFINTIATASSMTRWNNLAVQLGYHTVIAVPFLLPIGKHACLTLYSVKTEHWSSPECKLLQDLADDLAFGITALQAIENNLQYQSNLRDSLEKTIQVIAATGEERDAYTAGHQRRVAALCSKIATELQLSTERIQGLHLAASIHDLGKIGIPLEILIKPRQLTDLEYLLIKEHPTIGFNIIKDVSFPWPIADIILQHHERLDGSGYPKGLKGDEILLEAKILAVADLVEAMASHRPYRAALGIKAALTEITAQRGITLDAVIVDACLRIFNEYGYQFEN